MLLFTNVIITYFKSNLFKLKTMRKMKVMGMFLALSLIGGTIQGYASDGLINVEMGQQDGKCIGVVKDASGMTVIGASVIVKGTTNGTVTDVDGKFSLDGVKHGDVIQVSYVGYKDQNVTWNGQPLDIVLKEDTQALDEVALVG